MRTRGQRRALEVLNMFRVCRNNTQEALHEHTLDYTGRTKTHTS